MLALEQALQIIRAQDVWDVNDDLCDCDFQRIGYWNNPYIGKTLEVRMCCIWAELYKSFPQFVRETTAEPAQWNGETDMPKSLWNRQLANELGMTVAQARDMGLEPPKGQPVKARIPFVLNFGGREVEIDLARVRFR